jgi:hypothetical protein
MSIRTKHQEYVHQHGFACGHVASFTPATQTICMMATYSTHTSITLTNTFSK